MPHYDAQYRLQHMLNNAEEAISLIYGKTRTDLRKERMLELSLIRLVEVIGEAAAKIKLNIQLYPGRRLLECATG